jgi:carboxypeptidase Taq
MRPEQAYHELIQRTREASLLTSCIELLGWDEETYMPRAGVENRANQLAFMTGLEHDRATDPRLGELLGEVEGSDLVRNPDAVETINVRHLRRRYERAVRLPRRLVEESARVTTLAQQEWVSARQHADHAAFVPWLERIVALKVQEAEARGYDSVLYDALLEDYEPGARTQQLAELFAVLRRELVPLVAALADSGRRAKVGLLRGEFPSDRQRTFCEMVAGAVGFDFSGGRLDPTTHPFFSSIGPGDCRITTRYHPSHFSDGFFSMLHEVGHGLYEQGLAAEHAGTPMGEALSVGLHESQARLWENTVGRCRPFWQHFLPLARQIFREALGQAKLGEFYFAVNHVQPSLIRVQADEVTYNLHIMIRFELEQALLSGDLKPADLPGAWNDAFRHDLGIVPADDTEGCLQDGHWAAGLFGYFPTYTLGNVFAAQLFARARADMGDLDRQFRRGDFSGLLDWLRRHVHQHGHRYGGPELIEHVTGMPPSPAALLRDLREKYGALYKIL